MINNYSIITFIVLLSLIINLLWLIYIYPFKEYSWLIKSILYVIVFMVVVYYLGLIDYVNLILQCLITSLVWLVKNCGMIVSVILLSSIMNILWWVRNCSSKKNPWLVKTTLYVMLFIFVIYHLGLTSYVVLTLQYLGISVLYCLHLLIDYDSWVNIFEILRVSDIFNTIWGYVCNGMPGQNFYDIIGTNHGLEPGMFFDITGIDGSGSPSRIDLNIPPLIGKNKGEKGSERKPRNIKAAWRGDEDKKNKGDRKPVQRRRNSNNVPGTAFDHSVRPTPAQADFWRLPRTSQSARTRSTTGGSNPDTSPGASGSNAGVPKTEQTGKTSPGSPKPSGTSTPLGTPKKRESSAKSPPNNSRYRTDSSSSSSSSRSSTLTDTTPKATDTGKSWKDYANKSTNSTPVRVRRRQPPSRIFRFRDDTPDQKDFPTTNDKTSGSNGRSGKGSRPSNDTTKKFSGLFSALGSRLIISYTVIVWVYLMLLLWIVTQDWGWPFALILVVHILVLWHPFVWQVLLVLWLIFTRSKR